MQYKIDYEMDFSELDDFIRAIGIKSETAKAVKRAGELTATQWVLIELMWN